MKAGPRAAGPAGRFRRWRRLAVASAVLAVALWGLCSVSYSGEHDFFIASAVRPFNPGNVVTTNPPPMFARTETHLMLGHGWLAVRRADLSSNGAFDSPETSDTSRTLAWAVLNDQPMHWVWVGVNRGGPSGIVVTVWPLALLASMASAFVLRRYWREPGPGACPQCGYNLSGIPIGVCPECGTVPGRR